MIQNFQCWYIQAWRSVMPPIRKIDRVAWDPSGFFVLSSVDSMDWSGTWSPGACLEGSPTTRLFSPGFSFCFLEGEFSKHSTDWGGPGRLRRGVATGIADCKVESSIKRFRKVRVGYMQQQKYIIYVRYQAFVCTTLAMKTVNSNSQLEHNTIPRGLKSTCLCCF